MAKTEIVACDECLKTGITKRALYKCEICGADFCFECRGKILNDRFFMVCVDCSRCIEVCHIEIETAIKDIVIDYKEKKAEANKKEEKDNEKKS